ncbi:hypothetical protein JTE90_003827 [Oedothorax gibbosus]|uniref:ARID domain-containing protein n=1 Tax=Oedothorax gibbosus TaxID=931172 RepID=A0AAV6VG83_9ARAC|nr:hypothetical protein JTE90_003827 [Oedothorax gibbosus]
MEVHKPQFVGPPCGQYGGHQFYRRFKYCPQDGRTREVGLGEFFFVRMSAHEDPCIGELQLLCTSRNGEQNLSAIRLYFLPEQTPDGRLPHHGEHEVLVASDRVVLKLDDLASWVTEEVEWNHGIVAPWVESIKKEVEKVEELTPKKEVKSEPLNDSNNNTTTPENADQEIENVDGVEGEGSEKETSQNQVKEEVKVKEEKEEIAVSDPTSNEEPRVVVLSYQSYCRYRTILKRLEGGEKHAWLLHSLVLALGGFAPPSSKTHVLFCRDNFEHDELAHHELNCEYLAPTIKGKRRKRKAKNTRSISPESNTSEECKTIEAKKNQKQNGPKQPPVKNEQEFLQKLFKFMKKRNTPIHRVPNLGFKQIDLYIFYSFAQKLGGYDKVTGKRLWKHVYDELGGNPGSTSAATCTRRHYERLLLPFERFMAGILYKPAQRGKKSQKKKQQQEQQQKQELEQSKQEVDPKEPVPSTSQTPTKAELSANLKAEAEEVYAFTDSNHENSNSNEFSIVCEENEQAGTNDQVFSDEDSKTVWSIQKQPDNKDETSQDKDEGKPIKPLIIQKGQGETFAEKERKWDEIRKKNAAARKWVRGKMVRQSRSSNHKSCKTPVPEIPPFKQEKQTLETASTEQSTPLPTVPPVTIKTEVPDPVAIPTKPNECSPDKVVPESKIPSTPPSHKDSLTKFLSPGSTPDLPQQNGKIKLEPNHTPKKRHILAKETPSHLSADKKYITVAKTESRKHSNSWCGNSNNSEHSSSYPLSLHSGADGMSKGPLPASYKAGTRSEPDIARDYPMHTGRQSVGSMSASSMVSAEAASGEETKPLVPQRRASVIQHTEYAATSPSPSPSPIQEVAPKNVSPKESLPNVPFSSPKINLLPNQMSYSMNGKVADWLTKGIHEVVACKTPSTSIEKNIELHDRVMMPSSCKTPGAVGTGKVPVNNCKSKQASPKAPRSKNARQNNKGSNMNGLYNNVMVKNDMMNPMHPQKPKYSQKMHHPIPATYSVMNNKYQQAANQRIKPQEFYPNGPYYNQPKRAKVNHVLPPVINTRPSQLPFVRSTTYCTPPLGDIPKVAAITHNDYESAVLDLSVKRKPPVQAPIIPKPVVCPISPPIPEGVCLDLSVKKKPQPLPTTDNGIENITPPLSLSPNPLPSHPMSFMNSTAMKAFPTLIALQDLAVEDTARRGYNHRLPPPMTSTVTAPVACPPIHPQSSMFSAMATAAAHSKLPPGMVPPMYPKDMVAKNLQYMPGGNNSRHTQFPPYVIPPFFPTNWAAPAPGNPKPQTSPMAYKGMVNHSVFPKDYPYNIKQQFHPVLCNSKDSGHYPSNDKK